MTSGEPPPERARWRPGFLAGVVVLALGGWWLWVQSPHWRDAGSTWLSWLTIAVGLLMVLRAPPRTDPRDER